MGSSDVASRSGAEEAPPDRAEPSGEARTDLFGHPVREPLPLSQWLDELAALVGYDSGANMVAETGVCCWMESYTDGLTPAEAYREDCANA